jgi:hypothetical protein
MLGRMSSWTPSLSGAWLGLPGSTQRAGGAS